MTTAHVGAAPTDHSPTTRVAGAWVVSLVGIGSILPLLYPTGRPPSPRWRPVVWYAVIVAAFPVALAVAPTSLGIWLREPVTIPGRERPRVGAT